MQYILSFRGPAKAGKTTAAKIISKHFPNFVNVSFADELKIEAVEFLYELKEYARNEDCRLAQQFMDETKSSILGVYPSEGPTSLLREDILQFSNSHKEVFRTFFQWYGKFCRSVDSNYWIDRVDYQCTKHLKRYDDLTFDDCRFPNEKSWLKCWEDVDFCKDIEIKVFDIYVYNPELDLTLPVYKDESEAMNLTAQNAGAVLTNRPSYGIKEYEKRVLEMFSILKELT